MGAVVKLSATVKEAVADAEVEISQEEDSEVRLARPDLEQTKTAVLNSLTSASGQRPTTTLFANSSRGTVRSRALRSTAPWCSGTGSTSNSAGTSR